MAKHPSIAGVVLTLNEEKDLSRALKSLNWCDDLVVLDSGSSDHTTSIALAHNARVFVHVPSQPFLITDQRNWGLKNCDIECDWILFLDADEVITPALHSSIISSITFNPNITAYELAPRYLFLGKWLKHTQSYPTWHPRLVARDLVTFTGGVWESFSDTATIGRIFEPYDHFAFSKGLDDWLLRHLRYAHWEAQIATAFLENKDKNSFRTHRKLSFRILAARLWPVRPILRFSHKFILNGGFLDGWRGLLFCLLMFFYETMTVILIIQNKRESKSLPL